MAYTKTVWEDLPSTNTPITAENLNNIENGIETNDKKLSGEEVIGNIVVDSIKTKNMFDTNNVFNGFINTSNSSITYETDGKRYSGFTKIKPNTTYTISKQAGYSFRIATTTNYPANNVTYNTTEANHTATSMTITTGVNDNYLVFFFYAVQNGDTGGYEAMANTIQVEEGSIATTYSAYQNLNPNLNYSKTSYSSNGISIRFEKWGRIVQCTFEGTATSNLTANTDYNVSISSAFNPKEITRTCVIFNETGTIGYVWVDASQSKIYYRVKSTVNSPSYPRFSFTYISAD